MTTSTRDPLRPFSVKDAAARLRISEAQITALVEQGSLVGFRDETGRLVVLLPVDPDTESRTSGQSVAEDDYLEPFSPGNRPIGEEPERRASALPRQSTAVRPISDRQPAAEQPQWGPLKDAFEIHCNLVDAMLDKFAALYRSQDAQQLQNIALQVERQAAERQSGSAQSDDMGLDELRRRLDKLERAYALQEQDLEKLLEVTRLIRDHLETVSARRDRDS